MTKQQELLYAMDEAITAYIVACTGCDPATIDTSYINQDIEDAICMLDGEPAELL